MNQFSAVLVFIIIGLSMLALILWRLPAARRRPALLLGIVGLGLAGWLIFRPVHDGVTAVTVSDTLASGDGRPVLVELYSDY